MAIELRLGKSTKTGVGCRKDKNAKPYEMKRSGKMRRIGKTKRGREQRIFENYMRPLILQEVAEATGVDIEVLEGYHIDHINGRDAPGFEPLGAMFSPLNLQALLPEVHVFKTNAKTAEGQRFDYRDTATQERMVALTARLSLKLGKAFTLKELRVAIQSEIYYKEN